MTYDKTCETLARLIDRDNGITAANVREWFDVEMLAVLEYEFSNRVPTRYVDGGEDSERPEVEKLELEDWIFKVGTSRNGFVGKTTSGALCVTGFECLDVWLV